MNYPLDGEGIVAGAGYALFSAVAGGGPAAVSVSACAEVSCTSTGAVQVPGGSSASGRLDGSWKLTTGDSFVGYRVREQLAILPAPSDAVGRTTAVGGETISAGATGELTLHGVTNTACVPVEATLTHDAIQVRGTVGVVFSDYDIQAPNFGFVTTEDHGTIEFQLNFARS